MRPKQFVLMYTDDDKLHYNVCHNFRVMSCWVFNGFLTWCYQTGKLYTRPHCINYTANDDFDHDSWRESRLGSWVFLDQGFRWPPPPVSSAPYRHFRFPHIGSIGGGCKRKPWSRMMLRRLSWIETENFERKGGKIAELRVQHNAEKCN